MIYVSAPILLIINLNKNYDEKDFCRAVLAGEAKAYWNGSEFYG